MSLVLCARIIDNGSWERHWSRREESQIGTMSKLLSSAKSKLQALANRLKSTKDKSSKDKPFRRRDMQFYWVQKHHTASDNILNPYILYDKGPYEKVYVSHRVEEKSQNHLTTCAVRIGIAGFIAQFPGLRFSNWTCSIAQLIALGVATILHVWIHRGMTKTLGFVPVNNDYILDHLNLAIVDKRPSRSQFPSLEALWSPGLFLAFGVTTNPEFRAISKLETKSRVQPRSGPSNKANVEPVNFRL